MAQVTVKDATGADVQIEAPNPNGRAAASASSPVVLSTEDLAKLSELATKLDGVVLSDADKALLEGITAAINDLPTAGDASADNQATIIGELEAIDLKLAAIDGKLEGTLSIEASETVEVSGDFYPETQPVSAASLPLPTGAATAAGVGEVKDAIGQLIPQQWANRGQDTNSTHGSTGTRLVGILAIPLSKSPGKIRITDDPAQTADGMTIFEGGADSVSTLHPFMIPLGIKSHLGPWRVIFDANIRGIVLFD